MGLHGLLTGIALPFLYKTISLEQLITLLSGSSDPDDRDAHGPRNVGNFRQIETVDSRGDFYQLSRRESFISQ
jgi:hypothetical protein